MRSPTTALLWEIGQRHRWTIGGIAALTLAGRLIDGAHLTGPAADEASAVTTLCGMFAFLLLFSVFTYTESDGGPGLGRFPQRLFTLPVSSLRLVAIPVLTGILAIEFLYLVWADPLSRGGATSPLFVAILLAALMVFYLAVLWTCTRAGSLRLVIIGAIAVGLFAVGMLPSFPPTPPPQWRSEAALAASAVGLALITFVLTWAHVAWVRAGGGRSRFRLDSVVGRIADALPTSRNPFSSAAAAQFWFEWRGSGIVLPVLVAGVVLLVIAPISWLASSDARYTLWLLIGALATPIVLAIPVGLAFSKPTFWSEDLAVPAFVAVRPLSSHDLVAIKVKVASASAVLSWLVVLAFLAVWLSAWANLDRVSRLATQLFQGYSAGAVFGFAVLIPVAGMFLTWRSLVSHLWSGLSGMRPLFIVSVVAVVALVTAVPLHAGRVLFWLVPDPARFAPVIWIIVIAVIAKCAIAAYAWRGVPPRYRRVYLLIWLAGTASLVAFGIVVSGMLRPYPPFDVGGLRMAFILLALLAVPLARVGLAPLSFTRNRHR